MVKQVGKDLAPKKFRTKFQPKLLYSQVTKDKNGWVDAKKFLPKNFDLVEMKIDGNRLPGWYQGTSWDGYKFKTGQVVTHWRREE